MDLAEQNAGPGLGLQTPGRGYRLQGYAVTVHTDGRHACVQASWFHSHDVADPVLQLFPLEHLAKFGLQQHGAADPELELYSLRHCAECGLQQHAACCHADCEMLSCHLENPQACQQNAALSYLVLMAC